MKQRSAFTLTELSIVLIIIGIIVFGIMKGAVLVSSSRLANARSVTSKSSVADTPGLVAWYDTTSASGFKSGEAYDSSQISEWHDVSPGSVVLTKNKLTRTASSAVTYVAQGINLLPSIYFNGSSGANLSLSTFYQGNLAQGTIFIVFQPKYSPVLGSYIFLCDAYSTSSVAAIGIDSSTVVMNDGSGNTATSTASNSASFSSGKSYILAVYMNGSSSKAYSNNATTSAGNGTISPGSNPMVGLTVGSALAGGSAFTGFISEIIIYDRPLQMQERKDVMNYLGRKYQIVVSGL
jgi:prepilin-type N-terminal cleavage/methylation domain-containing protein